MWEGLVRVWQVDIPPCCSRQQLQLWVMYGQAGCFHGNQSITPPSAVNRPAPCSTARPPLTTGTEPGEREREIRADLTSLQWLLSVLHWLWSVTRGRRPNGQIDMSAVLRALCMLGYSSPEAGRLACFRDMHYACHHLLKFTHGRTHKL